MPPNIPIDSWKKILVGEPPRPVRKILALWVIGFLVSFGSVSLVRTVGSHSTLNFLDAHVLRPEFLLNPIEFVIAVCWILLAMGLAFKSKGLVFVWVLIFPLFFGGLSNHFVTIGVCCVGPTNSLKDFATNTALAAAASGGFALVLGTLGYILAVLISHGIDYQLPGSH